MKELVFIWVLFMPASGPHMFDTKGACEAFRRDQITTYGMNMSHCHKELLGPVLDKWLRGWK